MDYAISSIIEKFLWWYGNWKQKKRNDRWLEDEYGKDHSFWGVLEGADFFSSGRSNSIIGMLEVVWDLAEMLFATVKE